MNGKKEEVLVSKLCVSSENRQLDEASRSVFKENIRLNEALSYHMKEVEELRTVSVALAEENHSLTQHKVCHCSETSKLHRGKPKPRRAHLKKVFMLVMFSFPPDLW